jgi:hypothetical protein
MAKDLIEAIAKYWGWTGLRPAAIVAENAFGNVVVVDEAGRYWRIVPEDLECEPIAENGVDFERLNATEEFRIDWEMSRLAADAERKLGPLPSDRCYYLIYPSPLGGQYAPDNLATAPRVEVISLSGDIAEQIRDLPDGAKVKIKIARRE